jgi:diaminopimelate epimerase
MHLACGKSFYFAKMAAAGNIFMLVDGRQWPDDTDWSQLARVTSDWRHGVGHEGLLVVLRSARADIRQRMFNPDGTEDMCGNGLRCTAKYVLEAGLARSPMVIETIAGLRRVEALDNGKRSRHLRAEIGVATISPVSLSSALIADTEAPAEAAEPMLVDVGTPHLVIPWLGPRDDAAWRHISARLETEAVPGDRVTVSWYQREAESAFRARFWERAVGETASCGTGAAAILASARHNGLANTSAQVLAPGGTLHADVDPEGNIFVAGPATTLFTGHWPLD